MSDTKTVLVCGGRQVASVLPGLLNEHRPDIVLYDAGVDVHHDDRSRPPPLKPYRRPRVFLGGRRAVSYGRGTPVHSASAGHPVVGPANLIGK